jgi:hypothetical protein
VSRLISVDVVPQSPLVGHELLPANVTRVGSLQANRPVRGCLSTGTEVSPNVGFQNSLVRRVWY